MNPLTTADLPRCSHLDRKSLFYKSYRSQLVIDVRYYFALDFLETGTYSPPSYACEGKVFADTVVGH